MSLAPGTRLNHYEIITIVGAGGMGEVYRARDSRLNRDVAIKVLPAAFADDAERLARFQREAQMLASLNHPNIAQIHGVEESGTARALVMEFVDGEDLAERLKRGALPLEDALAIARQVAEALEAAHERGVIHRDLKPANIKIAPNGTVKVLDFGLAKAMDPTGGATAATNSPTFTSPAMTNMGIILGTAAYMSPEQAKGKPIDRRSDIWSLGVVLFEMLTGRALYEGETVTEVIAKVITQAPDLSVLPASTPPQIRRLLRRSLEKEPRNRVQSAGDVRLEIDEFLAGRDEPAASAPARRSSLATTWPLWVAGAAALAVIAALALWRPWERAAAPQPAMRLDMRIGSEAEMIPDNNMDGELAVLSPDGQTLAFVGTAEGVRRIYVRPLNSTTATPLSGTEGARCHFFSPDGRWIAFFASGTLQKVAVTGGAAVKIAQAPDTRGGAWGEGDTIVFTPVTSGGLLAVPAGGGTPTELTKLADGERSHRWPWFLPGGRAVLFVRQNHEARYDDGLIEVVRLDSKQRTTLVRGGTFPRYLASGHIVYARENTLFAVPFDAERLTTSGEAQPILSGVLTSGGEGAGAGDGSAQFAVAQNGTAIYLAGAPGGAVSQLIVTDRGGKIVYTHPERREFRDPHFSPDGKKIALQIADGLSRNIYVLDLDRRTLTKVTFDGASNGMPIWTPDGKRLAFFSDRSQGGLNIHLVRSDGAGEVETFTKGPSARIPMSFSPKGELLAYMEQGPTSMDVNVVDLTTKQSKPFAAAPNVDELMPAFSPDGKWIAYMSVEGRVPEIFVRPYPGPGGKWQISAGGAGIPVWTKEGGELVYVAGLEVSQVMAVDIDVDGEALKPGKPQQLFTMPMARPSNATMFHATSDGQKFVLLTPEGEARSGGFTHITLVVNFFDEVRRALRK